MTLQWILYNEGKTYPVVSDGDAYRAMINREGGPEALKQWKALEKAIKPLQEGAASFPAAAIRNDIGEPCKDDASALLILIYVVSSVSSPKTGGTLNWRMSSTQPSVQKHLFI